MRSLLGAACSAAASPLLTPVTYASVPSSENRLVVILLRGAMDGLDAIRPVGDPDYARLRPDGDTQGPALAGPFVLHPALSGLSGLWDAGALAFAHAVSTPYRDRRSHFDGQELLETGGNDARGPVGAGADGWLNRALAHIPGARRRTALAVGTERLLVLSGEAPVIEWAPDAAPAMSAPTWDVLERLYAEDALFRTALAEARLFSRESGSAASRGIRPIAEFAARELAGEARIAAFSIGGWDTHRLQARLLPRALGELQTAVLSLKDGLGPLWSRTAVLCVTEFGRTARLNGSDGTDHGTGGVALFAGGALRGGVVHGRWPGLGEGALYEDRDLQPTEDVRRFAGWLLRDLYGLDRSVIEDRVFPGLALGDRPRLIA